MKLTKSKLKRIIKEELNKVLNEDGDWSADSPMGRAEADRCGALKQALADAIWEHRDAGWRREMGRGDPVSPVKEDNYHLAQRARLEEALEELGCDYSELPAAAGELA